MITRIVYFLICSAFLPNPSVFNDDFKLLFLNLLWQTCIYSRWYQRLFIDKVLYDTQCILLCLPVPLFFKILLFQKQEIYILSFLFFFFHCVLLYILMSSFLCTHAFADILCLKCNTRSVVYDEGYKEYTWLKLIVNQLPKLILGFLNGKTLKNFYENPYYHF